MINRFHKFVSSSPGGSAGRSQYTLAVAGWEATYYEIKQQLSSLHWLESLGCRRNGKGIHRALSKGKPTRPQRFHVSLEPLSMENLFLRCEFSLEIEIDRIMKRKMMPRRSRNDVWDVNLCGNYGNRRRDAFAVFKSPPTRVRPWHNFWILFPLAGKEEGGSFLNLDRKAAKDTHRHKSRHSLGNFNNLRNLFWI